MAGLRINHNTAAINAHRNMITNDKALSRTLERLSSGLKINRASDGPAALLISEQMRAQISGLKQAVMNSETAVSIVQTTEAALDEVNKALVNMRQLAIHASNEGANDDKMLAADQAEIVNSLDSIDRIARSTQFGTKFLLDGSNGVNGSATGDLLNFVSASKNTKASLEGGYSIVVTKAASQAQVVGQQVLSQELIDAGETLTIFSNGKNVSYKTEVNDTTDVIQTKLQSMIDKQGLGVNITFDEDGHMIITHKEYGSNVDFEVVSTTSGILSTVGNVPAQVNNGQDVVGMIDDEFTTGSGQFLTGGRGTKADGLTVRYQGDRNFDEPTEVGRVAVRQNSLNFQIGANSGQTTKVALPNTNSDYLGQNVVNASNYESIRDIDVTDFVGAQDALTLIDKAINEVTTTRAELGAIQKNTLESNIRSLQIARENLINSESVIRDADMAEEMSEFTRAQIMMKTSTAMLAQANQTPQNILTLLK